MEIEIRPISEMPGPSLRTTLKTLTKDKAIFIKAERNQDPARLRRRYVSMAHDFGMSTRISRDPKYPGVWIYKKLPEKAKPKAMVAD